MRDKPRYSIIPAGAVTDHNLEGRDLQVLCLLGCHSDKLGWCEASSQSELAKIIDCSRQTFQRAIARLVGAGWVQTKTAFVSENGRPYAPYAYRVIMDRDDPDILPTEHEVAAPIPEEGAHERAPLPTGGHHAPASGHPCPHIRGHQESDQVRDLDVGVEDVRARESLISVEAKHLADQIAAIAGFPDPKNFPPGWCGAAMRVDAFLRDGYHPEILLLAAREAMAARKDPEPPWSIGYFEKPFAKARARQQQPLPVVKTPNAQEVTVDGAVKLSSNKSATAAALRARQRSLDSRADRALDVSIPPRRLRES